MMIHKKEDSFSIDQSGDFRPQCLTSLSTLAKNRTYKIANFTMNTLKGKRKKRALNIKQTSSRKKAQLSLRHQNKD